MILGVRSNCQAIERNAFLPTVNRRVVGSIPTEEPFIQWLRIPLVLSAYHFAKTSPDTFYNAGPVLLSTTSSWIMVVLMSQWRIAFCSTASRVPT